MCHITRAIEQLSLSLCNQAFWRSTFWKQSRRKTWFKWT